MAIPLRRYEKQVKTSAETGARQISGSVASEMIGAAGASDMLVAKTFEALGEIGVKAYKDFNDRKDEAEITRINNEFLIDSAAYQNSLNKAQTFEEAEGLKKNFLQQQNAKSEGFNLSRKRKREAQLKFSNNLAQMEVAFADRVTKIELEKQNTAYSQARVNALNNGIYDTDQFTSAKEAYDYYTDKLVEAGIVSGAVGVEEKSNFDINRQRRIDLETNTFNAGVNEAVSNIRLSWAETEVKINEANMAGEKEAIYNEWRQGVNQSLAFDLSESEAAAAQEKIDSFLIAKDDFIQNAVSNRMKQHTIDSLQEQITEYLDDPDGDPELIDDVLNELQQLDPIKYNEEWKRKQSQQIVSAKDYRQFKLDLQQDILLARDNIIENTYDLSEADKQRALLLFEREVASAEKTILSEQNKIKTELWNKSRDGLLTEEEIETASQTQTYRGIEYNVISEQEKNNFLSQVQSTTSNEMDSRQFNRFNKELEQAIRKKANGEDFSLDVNTMYEILDTRDSKNKDKPLFSKNTILKGMEQIQKALFSDDPFSETDLTMDRNEAYLNGVSAITSVYQEQIELNMIKGDAETVRKMRTTIENWDAFIDDYYKENQTFPPAELQQQWFNNELGVLKNQNAVRKAMKIAYIQSGEGAFETFQEIQNETEEEE